MRRRRWGRRIGIALLVLLLLLVGFGVYIDATLNRISALPADSKNTSKGTNWLIVGSDSRQKLTEEQRKKYATGDDASQLTDTIMVLHTGSGPTTLVSIPRDSQVKFPGGDNDFHKINAAYGQRGGPDGGGPELLVRTVEQKTRLHIDHYVEIGFLGVAGLVDAVGGVDLCVPKAIKDPLAGLDIQAGCQLIDEKTAVGYVRTRELDSDFERVKRQRAFLSALLSKVTSPGTLLNPFRVVPLSTQLAGSLTVDSGTHVWNLAAFGLALRGLSDGISTTVPVRDGVVNWDEAKAAKLFDALRNDQRPPEDSLGAR